MDPHLSLLIALVLGACAGLLLVMKLRTRLWEDQPQAGPEPPRPSGIVTRQTGASLIIGPSEALVVGPALPFRAGPSSSDEPVLVGLSEDPVLVVGPAEPLVVEPPPRGVWDERGWTRCSNNGRITYEGYFQVLDRRSGRPRRFAGQVVVGQRSITPYIADPPQEVKRHPKGPCFTLMKAPWFQIEWRRPAANVDDAILYVERILDEALNGRRA